MDNLKYLIVPDVHGRDFYEYNVNTFLEQSEESKVIFLGDYIDPYPQEGITPESALERLKTIIELKRKYKDRVTLLIGNHDFHYIDGSRRGCRMDYYNKDEICGLYIKNIGLFDYVKCETIGRKNFIFTHAGFLYGWFYVHFDLININGDEYTNADDVAKCFTYDTIKNTDWKSLSDDRHVLNAYGEIGTSRGGYANYPSFLWADVTDLLFDPSVASYDFIQVFGHTRQQIGHYIKYGNCYCLDCRKVFFINSDGEVLCDNMDRLNDNGEEYKKSYMEYIRRSLF